MFFSTEVGDTPFFFDNDVVLGSRTSASRLHLQGTTASHYATIDTGIDLNFVGTPDAPTASVGGAGNVEAGNHYYYVAYITDLGETDAKVSAKVTLGVNSEVTVTIPVSSDYRVTGRKLFRTKANDASWKTWTLATINNNVDTEYIDNIADGDLTGTLYEGYYQPDTTNSIFLADGVKSAILSGKQTLFGVNSKAGGAGVVFGQNAGTSITSATQSTFIGDSAGHSVTSGASNTFVGYTSGSLVKTGTANAGVGRNSIPKVASYNIGMGYSAGYYQISSNSVFLGAYSGYGSSGADADSTTAVGYGAGYSLKEGNDNTLLGFQAGYSLTAGSDNIIIGYKSGLDETGSNTLMIDNVDRTSEALGRTGAIIYGQMSATPSEQNLTFNANVNVSEDLNVVGNFTGNQIYGEMWYHNHTATELTFAIKETWYPMFFTNATSLNGFTYVGGHMESSNLTAQVNGKYKASYKLSGDGQNNHIYMSSILINGVEQENCADHKKMSAGGDIIPMGHSGCFIDLVIGDNIQVAVMDYAGTGTGNYYSGNLNLMRIGT